MYWSTSYWSASPASNSRKSIKYYNMGASKMQRANNNFSIKTYINNKANKTNNAWTSKGNKWHVYKQTVNNQFGGNVKTTQHQIINNSPTKNSNMRTNNNTKKINQLPTERYRSYINGSFTDIKLVKQLGKGGEGTVYDCDSYKLNGKYVAKIYHKCDATTESKIKHMIANQPKRIESDTFRICWPEFIITDQYNKFCGYIMKKGFDNSVELYHLTKEKIKIPEFKGFENQYRDALFKKLKILFYTCVPIYHIINDGKYVMVDIKPQNILTDTKGRISILDTDSFQISDNYKVIYNAKVITPEYTPREYANVVPSKIKYNVATDMFAIGVTFYQILMGIHPYVVRPKNDKLTTITDFIYNDLFAHGNKEYDILGLPKPHKTFERLDPRIQELFVKTFTSINRPNITKWGETLGTVINELAGGQSKNPSNESKVQNKPTHTTVNNSVVKDAIDGINKSKQLLAKYKTNITEEQEITELLMKTNIKIHEHIVNKNIMDRQRLCLNKLIFISSLLQWKYLTGFITAKEIQYYVTYIDEIIHNGNVVAKDIHELGKATKNIFVIQIPSMMQELKDTVDKCKELVIANNNRPSYIKYVDYDMETYDILRNNKALQDLYESIGKHKLDKDTENAVKYNNGLMAITINEYLNKMHA